MSSALQIKRNNESFSFHYLWKLLLFHFLNWKLFFIYSMIPTWLLAQKIFMVTLINKAMKLSQELKGENKTTKERECKREWQKKRERLGLSMLDISCRYDELSYLIAYESIMMHNFSKAVLQTENMLYWHSSWSEKCYRTDWESKEWDRSLSSILIHGFYQRETECYLTIEVHSYLSAPSYYTVGMSEGRRFVENCTREWKFEFDSMACLTK